VSSRLQVLLPPEELADIQRIARRENLSVGEWVRRSLREARSGKPVTGPEKKLKAVRRAVNYAFPSGDIDQMLAEIGQGAHIGLVHEG